MKNLKDLNITIEQLYNEDKQILINTNKGNFTLVMMGREYFKRKPDCMLSSFKNNLYIRTNKGMNKEKYKTLASLQTEIKKLINNKTTLEFKGFELNNTIDIF